MIKVYEDNRPKITLNDVYKVLVSHNIDKYSSDFSYNKDFETISFRITTGQEYINKYPVGDYTVFDNEDNVTVQFWEPGSSDMQEYNYTLEEFDSKMTELYRYCSRFYG